MYGDQGLTVIVEHESYVCLWGPKLKLHDKQVSDAG